MDRLDEIIQELNEQGRYIPNEGLSEETARVIIALLRAGAEMRELHRQFSDRFVGFHPKCAEAWDAALRGEE